MSILILGDVHLNKSLSLGKSTIGSALNSRVVDQLNLLEWTLEQAIDNNTSHLILTGDVFDDPKPSASIVSIFISWLRKCQLHHINVHIIAGNHDILRTGVTYSSPLDIVESCDIEGIYIYRICLH